MSESALCLRVGAAFRDREPTLQGSRKWCVSSRWTRILMLSSFVDVEMCAFGGYEM